MKSPQKNAVMVLLLDPEGKVLMVKRHPAKPAGGYWCPVSGKVEAGETEADAVIRECMEEVSLTVLPLRKLGQMPCSTGEFLLHWWLAAWVSGEAYVKAPDELTQLQWADPGELHTLQPHFTEDIKFICSALEHSGHS